jgi:hypothetical protein
VERIQWWITDQQTTALHRYYVARWRRCQLIRKHVAQRRYCERPTQTCSGQEYVKPARREAGQETQEVRAVSGTHQLAFLDW